MVDIGGVAIADQNIGTGPGIGHEGEILAAHNQRRLGAISRNSMLFTIFSSVVKTNLLPELITESVKFAFTHKTKSAAEHPPTVSTYVEILPFLCRAERFRRRRANPLAF